MAQSFSERFKLAQRLLSVKQKVAQAISDRFFLVRPDLEVRYGERGRQFCTADTCFHIEFLAGAIQAGSPEAFADYVRWTARMLDARGIDAHSLEENFTQLEEHLSPVLSPAERSAVSTFLDSGRRACAGSRATSELQSSDGPLSLTERAFLAAILSGQRRAALGIVEEALRNGVRHLEIYIDVITESLRSIGSLWEQNKISVAQEHMASAIAQYVIAMIYPRLVPASPSRGNMVVTGVSGERHQIGANLVADALEESGWSVRFLGTDLPHSTILSTIEETSADVLCISTTLVANLPSAADLVKVVRGKLGMKAPRIVAGGAAYRITPSFADEIGPAEAIPDLRQALVTLCPERVPE
jgi:methanogenic corrinoid protein MtbC1